MNLINEKVKIIISSIGSLASITGLSLYSVFNSNHEFSFSSYLFIALFIIGLISIIVLYRKLNELRRSLRGYKVKYHSRSELSMAFARSTLRSIYIFGGDINNWLINDLSVYKELIENKSVSVKVLLDNPNSKSIAIGKTIGIEFKLYPYKMKAPVKGCLFDTEDEIESRALIVKKKSLNPNIEKGGNYNYWFKEYYGYDDAMIIRGLKSHFELLFSKGLKL